LSFQVTPSAASAATAIEGRLSIVPKAASSSSALLPPPGAAALDGTEDALAMIYTLLGRQQTLSMTVGAASVKTQQSEQSVQIGEERRAEEQQTKANESSGFWNDLVSICETVAKVAGLVVLLAAGAVAAVFTGGTTAVAAVAVAAVLVSTGMVVSATHCFGKASGWIGMGMEAVASVLTFGAASGAVASSAAAQATQAVGSAALYVQGGATVAGGVSTEVAGHEEAVAQNDAADVQQAVNEMSQESRMVDDVVAGLKNTEQSSQKAMQLVAGVAETYSQTMTLAASGRA
jgi:hypothetical protein